MAPKKLDKLEKIKWRRVNPGTYPGQNRSRKFVDKKKEGKKKGCRGRLPKED